MFNQNNYKDKMSKTLDKFSKDLSTLSTGRANSNMLDLIRVDVYGQKMPINQIGTITAPEPRVINIQVWDLNNVNLIDTAIKKSDLGLNPQIDGQLIRLPIPDLSEERRNELAKMIKSMGEQCKISIRNIRRDIEKKEEKNIQSLTDENIKKIDEKILTKEKEIMTI